jgi:hypothetical protein
MVVWTVRKVTQPLVRYAAALDQLVVETDTSVDGAGLPTELHPVSRAIDRLLAKVPGIEGGAGVALHLPRRVAPVTVISRSEGARLNR